MGLSTECDLPVRCTTKKVLGTEVQGYRYRKHLSQKKIESLFTLCAGTFFVSDRSTIYKDLQRRITKVDTGFLTRV
jgi:hypothetical protein